MGAIASTQLSEEMEKLHVAVLEPNSKLQNGGDSDASPTEGYTDDIEAEANSYFQQMFSGQLTIEAMVQMLARFKESSVKRCFTFIIFGVARVSGSLCIVLHNCVFFLISTISLVYFDTR